MKKKTNMSIQVIILIKFGINENFKIDQSKHSLFGASKLSADILVQEYGRYFGMKTGILRRLPNWTFHEGAGAWLSILSSEM